MLAAKLFVKNAEHFYLTGQGCAKTECVYYFSDLSVRRARGPWRSTLLVS